MGNSPTALQKINQSTLLLKFVRFVPYSKIISNRATKIHGKLVNEKDRGFSLPSLDGCLIAAIELEGYRFVLVDYPLRMGGENDKSMFSL